MRPYVNLCKSICPLFGGTSFKLVLKGHHLGVHHVGCSLNVRQTFMYTLFFICIIGMNIYIYIFIYTYL